MLTLEPLKILVEAVQAGSFTRAADPLATGKSHVGRAVCQLKAELGTRLLARTTRTRSVAEPGRRYSTAARPNRFAGAVGSCAGATERASGLDGGTVRLGIPVVDG